MPAEPAASSPDDIDRRNYNLNLLEGFLYIGSSGFLAPQTTLPAVTQLLGGSPATIGLIPLIGFAVWFIPQLLSARLLERYPVRIDFLMLTGSLQRLIVLLMGTALFVFAPRSTGLALTAFLVLYVVNQLAVGMTTPAWYDMISKVTPAIRRGGLIGIRSAGGTFIALLSGLAVAAGIDSIPYPLNYACIFWAAAALQFSSLLVQRQIREKPSAHPGREGRSDVSMRTIVHVIRNDINFRNFIAVCILLTASTMGNAFFIVYGFVKFSVPTEFIGIWTTVMMAGQIIGSLLMGHIGDRFGYRWALATACGWMVVTVLASLVITSGFWYGLVFFFLGLNLGTDMMSRFNMAVELAPLHRRPVYIALLSTATAPFYILSLAAGALIGVVGYRGIFILSAFFAVCALGWLFLRVREPRDADV